MVSRSNLIQCAIIFTLLLSYQVDGRIINDDADDRNHVHFGEILEDLISNHHDQQYYHPEYRRASLRYHPHVLYKKASLKPIIGQKGKLFFVK